MGAIVRDYRGMGRMGIMCKSGIISGECGRGRESGGKGGERKEDKEKKGRD
jgi:hypothetical protein